MLLLLLDMSKIYRQIFVWPNNFEHVLRRFPQINIPKILISVGAVLSVYFSFRSLLRFLNDEVLRFPVAFKVIINSININDIMARSCFWNSLWPSTSICIQCLYWITLRYWLAHAAVVYLRVAKNIFDLKINLMETQS